MPRIKNQFFLLLLYSCSSPAMLVLRSCEDFISARSTQRLVMLRHEASMNLKRISSRLNLLCVKLKRTKINWTPLSCSVSIQFTFSMTKTFWLKGFQWYNHTVAPTGLCWFMIMFFYHTVTPTGFAKSRQWRDNMVEITRSTTQAL